MKNGIIAFCGSKGAGKSTSAAIFKNQYAGETEELAFAGHLKSTCSEVFKIDMKYFLVPELKEVELESYINLTRQNIEEVFKGFGQTDYNFDTHIRPHMGQVFDTPRSLLQYVGTELLQPLDPLIHVNITLKNKDPKKLSIVTDLRFTQEFEALMKRDDFVAIYVYNHGAESAAQGDLHPSEQQLKLFRDKCIKLHNNDTLQSLTTGIKALIETYYK